VAASAKKTVLFMDDELHLNQHYLQQMDSDGFRVITASSEAEAKDLFGEKAIDIAVLDANLLRSSEIVRIKETQRLVGDEPFVEEEGAGFRVAAWVRENSPRTGVIILSAERTEPSDRINGLDCGADDYAIKGMQPAEFSSRVKALVRRINPQTSRISFGPFSLDLDRRTISVEDREAVALTTSEAQLMALLASPPIKAKSRAELHVGVFERSPSSSNDRAIDNLISKIRRKSREGLGQELPVKTVYAGGYILAI